MEKEQIEQFVTEGFVRIEEAFPRELADECRSILWKDSGCDPEDRATWTRPVVRLGDYSQEPFRLAANTDRLCKAFDLIVGKDRWTPRVSLGTFPVRFPSAEDPGDTGWHIDASFAAENSDPNNFLSWHVNINSRGRALLMLFLFSDVGEMDAPTRIRAGSHLDVARLLEPAGAQGISFFEISQAAEAATVGRREVYATGAAGTVYLCHPFLLHASQRHQGMSPRFIAQPPLYPAAPFQLHREDRQYSPVEAAIRLGLGLDREL